MRALRAHAVYFGNEGRCPSNSLGYFGAKEDVVRVLVVAIKRGGSRVVRRGCGDGRRRGMRRAGC